MRKMMWSGLIMLFCAAGMAFAQEKAVEYVATNVLTPPMKTNNLGSYTQEIGFAAGIVSGIGMSYRYWPGDWGVQVFISPYYYSQDRSLSLSLGVYSLHALFRTDWTRFFLFYGVHFNYWEDSVTYYPSTNSEFVRQLDVDLGIGPGIEIFFFENLSLNIQAGLVATINNALAVPIPTSTGLNAEIAFMYRY